MEHTVNTTGIKRGISGSTIKMIAIVTMLIDHVGAAIVYRMLLLRKLDNPGMDGWPDFLVVFANRGDLYAIYRCLRLIGRIAFPIFCFLLIEGFRYTRDKKKYGIRLFLFALISEIPFDLAFSGRINGNYQNVFFTLFLGYLTIAAVHFAQERQSWKIWQRLLGIAAVILIGVESADLLKTDYSGWGVCVIVILYLLRDRKWMQILAGALAFLYEITAPLAFLPIAIYNGKRGWKLKYFFYLFYPLHLLFLYFICCVLGINGISTV